MNFLLKVSLKDTLGIKYHICAVILEMTSHRHRALHPFTSNTNPPTAIAIITFNHKIKQKRTKNFKTK